jgi:formate-dependent nitrite reductase cytochrome c552 subunit
VVGSRWKQRYLVKNETTGNLQLLDRQFNRATGKWEDYRQKSDWNTTCAACHTTGYRITAFDQQSGRTLKSEFAEMGVGCEACHGPGGQHVVSAKGDDIFNPANADIKMQSKLCGYCHVRLENQKWLSAQGEPRQDLPAPNPGETYLAGDDWTLWYPQQVVIPGVQPEDPFDRDYAGQLQGMFKTDELARSSGIYDEARNHQQYQGFIQSGHYRSGISCITCHAPHGHKGKIRKVPQNACNTCHDDSYTVDKYMPNTGMTADNLFVRSHSFSKTPRQGATNPGKLAEPTYYGN